MKNHRFIVNLGLAAILMLSLVACNSKDENSEEANVIEDINVIEEANGTGEETEVLEKFTYNFFGTFDTIVSTVLYAENQEEADEYNAYIEERFNELHRLYDTYHNYEGINNLKTVNDMAGIEAVKVDKEVFDLIKLSIDRYHKYGGTDISFGRVIEIWQHYHDINEDLTGDESIEDLLPKREELEEANQYTNIDNIVLDDENQTIYITDENTKIDVGATAKGYAVELVANELEEKGCFSGLISGGGNVKAIGKPADGVRDRWGVAIRNPKSMELGSEADTIFETLFIDGLSVVTSGDYERFFEVDGKRYHHVIDTDTLYPANHFSSLTIVHKDSGLADFLSTSVYMMTIEEGRELIDSIDGAEAFWINYDGSYEYTEGMEKMMLSKGATGAKK